MSEAPERKCRTCRFWDVHSWPRPSKGDCRAPNLHRHWRGEAAGVSFLMDGFGPEATGPLFTCNAWEASHG